MRSRCRPALGGMAGMALLTAALISAVLITSSSSEPYTDYEPAAKPAGAGPRPEVTFTASLTRQGRSLRVAYRIVNTGSVPLVIFNGSPGEQGPATARDPQAYVTARRNGTVEIAKRTFRVPPGVEPYALFMVAGAVVLPGSAAGDTFDAALPLVPGRPYLDSAKLHLPDPLRRVVFCLGVVRQDVLPERLRDGATFPHPSPQHLFCSAEQKLSG